MRYQHVFKAHAAVGIAYSATAAAGQVIGDDYILHSWRAHPKIHSAAFIQRLVARNPQVGQAGVRVETENPAAAGCRRQCAMRIPIADRKSAQLRRRSLAAGKGDYVIVALAIDNGL
jgi:hypothetical protein